ARREGRWLRSNPARGADQARFGRPLAPRAAGHRALSRNKPEIRGSFIVLQVCPPRPLAERAAYRVLRHGQKSDPITSPPLRVNSARSVSFVMEFEMKWTEPSASAARKPPGKRPPRPFDGVFGS